MSLPLTGSKTCVLPREIASRQERFTRETLVPTLFSPTLVTIDGVKSHGLIFFDFFFFVSGHSIVGGLQPDQIPDEWRDGGAQGSQHSTPRHR